MSGRGICLICFRGRGGSVAESSEGPTASKSDRTGRNPGMTRLVRRSRATSGGTAFFSLVQTFRQRMRKCSGSPIRTIPRRDAGFYQELTFQLIVYRHKRPRNVRTARVWCSLDRCERWFHADWDA